MLVALGESYEKLDSMQHAKKVCDKSEVLTLIIKYIYLWTGLVCTATTNVIICQKNIVWDQIHVISISVLF